MDTLNVSATGNGLNYLPEYVADAGGLFAARGLAVRAKACDPWTGVLDDLDSGAADLALGGLWVPAMYVGTPRQLDVVGQLNHHFADLKYVKLVGVAWPPLRRGVKDDGAFLLIGPRRPERDGGEGEGRGVRGGELLRPALSRRFA